MCGWPGRSFGDTSNGASETASSRAASLLGQPKACAGTADHALRLHASHLQIIFSLGTKPFVTRMSSVRPSRSAGPSLSDTALAPQASMFLFIRACRHGSPIRLHTLIPQGAARIIIGLGQQA